MTFMFASLIIGSKFQSPGTLPAYVTVKNILVERFARNPKIVRLLNKFKNPPNKDVGEGLNTAFDAMKKLKLKDPVIEQRDNYVMISLKHEKLGTPEQIIVEYLRTNKQISTSVARKICVTSQSAVQRAFKKLTINGLIERSDDKEHLSYVKGPKFPQ